MTLPLSKTNTDFFCSVAIKKKNNAFLTKNNQYNLINYSFPTKNLEYNNKRLNYLMKIVTIRRLIFFL